MTKGYTEITSGGYEYAKLRVGLSLRRPDGKEVYFQPGDDESAILDQIAALDETADHMRADIADMIFADYFEGVE